MKVTLIKQLERWRYVIQNTILAIVAIIFLFFSLEYKVQIDIRVVYGEEHNIDGTYAQLFYAEQLKDMCEEQSYRAEIKNQEAVFHLKPMDFSKTVLRLDPLNQEEDFTIKRIAIEKNGKTFCSIDGKALYQYFDLQSDIKCKIINKNLKVYVLSDDPRMVLSKEFCAKIVDVNKHINNIPFYSVVILYIILGIVELHRVSNGSWDIAKKNKKIVAAVTTGIFFSVGLGLNYGVYYLKQNFSEVPIGQIIYHLHTPLEGTNTSSFSDIIGIILLIFIIDFGVFGFICKKISNKKQLSVLMIFFSFMGVILSGRAMAEACYHFNLTEYYEYISQDTEIYDKYYVDARNVELTFPQNKRNLIYIFLESMETTYADTEIAGGMKENYIPELAELSLQNENFGVYGVLNGANTVPGATFTMGALIAQTSGVPINENLVSNDTLNATWESDNNYLPGVWALGDILQQQGYQQEFMIGSDGKFAGRASYFKGHGSYEIFDYYTAIDRGYINENYYEWWGYEDKKLFEYAKKEITRLANNNEPFNFTMLTADTHFTDGYLCDECEDEFDSQYSNVIACSSRQVARFVEWIQQQDFYDNTTIILSGDHLTMDSDYIQKYIADNATRKTYIAVINEKTKNENMGSEREYTTLDMFPTTLAAMGVQIEGNRLGLGVNLYSGEHTLLEEYGEDYLNIEFLKDSKFYRQKLLYGK